MSQCNFTRKWNALHNGVESNITALLFVEDTEAKGIATIHGRVDFIQLVGITQQELEVLKEDYTQVEIFINNMKKDNPYLYTDVKRGKSYL